MSRRIRKQRAARADLLEHFVYTAEKYSVELAERFFAATEEAFDRLLDHPELGVRRHYRNARLSDLRMWPIPGFSKYLIFYLPTDDGIQIVRILHGSRNVAALFSDGSEEE